MFLIRKMGWACKEIDVQGIRMMCMRIGDRSKKGHVLKSGCMTVKTAPLILYLSFLHRFCVPVLLLPRLLRRLLRLRVPPDLQLPRQSDMTGEYENV